MTYSLQSTVSVRKYTMKKGLEKFSSFSLVTTFTKVIGILKAKTLILIQQPVIILLKMYYPGFKKIKNHEDNNNRLRRIYR